LLGRRSRGLSFSHQLGERFTSASELDCVFGRSGALDYRNVLICRSPAYMGGHAEYAASLPATYDAVVEEMGFVAAHFGGSTVCLGAGRSDEVGQLLPHLFTVQE
jgi:hypothetical protein